MNAVYPARMRYETGRTTGPQLAFQLGRLYANATPKEKAEINRCLARLEKQTARQ